MYPLLNHCELQGGMMEAGVMGVSSRASQDLFSQWVWFIIYPHGPGNSGNWDSVLEWCAEVSCTFPVVYRRSVLKWNPIRLVSTERHLIFFLRFISSQPFRIFIPLLGILNSTTIFSVTYCVPNYIVICKLGEIKVLSKPDSRNIIWKVLWCDVAVKNMDLEVRLPRLESWLHHIPVYDWTP